ncbi:uncharacterized protein LOC121503361 isoform X1 [Xyrichtys novacula]|uniref:Uncharacterized protein LOC121503361 isoform X1 n=1 Tax=Xyrichtys novacula TaxID=13765 RepID=A0AAV1GPR8_XYRNO|nr:uncharacterized protein LOC121503361 isoform X1 [Xyrichtys novacula]
MGNSSSDTSSEDDLRYFTRDIEEGPDLKVCQSILKFCSLSSTDSLKQHYEKRRTRASDHAAKWIKDLAEKLGPFTNAPELAGLGALAIAVLIDMVASTSSEEATIKALQSVFAEEKSSEVWNLIDECLKRYRMYIGDTTELRRSIHRMEDQLSTALTRLKNSILRDEHVTNQAVKVWVNGAAFHVQMLIHLVRLGGIQTCDPVERLIRDYKDDLEAVFEKHKMMIKKKCDTYFYSDPELGLGGIYFVDEKGRCREMSKGDFPKYYNAYYEERYGKQEREILKYFRDVERNLPELVQQRGSLYVY